MLSPTSSQLLEGADLDAALDDLSATGADFHRRGWSLGTSSNYSVLVGRDPLELMVTVSGKDKGRLGRGDYVRVGADGKPVEAGAPSSSAETMLHVVLAEQPGVGAVLHTHSPAATLLSDRYARDGVLRLSGYEMLKGLAAHGTHESTELCPIFENTQDIPTLAEQVRERLTDAEHPLRHGFLIRKHGLYAWGADIAEARRHIEVFEFLMDCELRRLSLS
ncbi:Methylthioribulose-1-phosphate dehydratase [Posidoniimonas polymericola]|uniref:Methylthioribulose-1-phosphate dehydratase n=1 Tax=Posidoniimonas polymericola TaxID=2528002 RepID=A0A5C5YQI3_9BACT|nr:methylthioribulose 1-phosphate dehydratase [Posidoniimonas polymericola]TWT77194.1 Methylthioribulose-1-phosphate dehydratase [Posidoniimonas polymericola]